MGTATILELNSRQLDPTIQLLRSPQLQLLGAHFPSPPPSFALFRRHTKMKPCAENISPSSSLVPRRPSDWGEPRAHGAAVLLDSTVFAKRGDALASPETSSQTKKGVHELPTYPRERTSLLIAREESAAERAFTPTHVRSPSALCLDEHPLTSQLLKTQYVTIYTIEIYFVFLLLSWNLKYIRTCLFPFKLLTVGLHECWYVHL